MREARIILPGYQRNGAPVDSHVLPRLEAMIIDAFGGFTCMRGIGAYRMNDGTLKQEPVAIFDIAIKQVSFRSISLHDIALWVANAANQECVYLRHPNGSVEFVSGASMD
jgi:hypothetical protein